MAWCRDWVWLKYFGSPSFGSRETIHVFPKWVCVPFGTSVRTTQRAQMTKKDFLSGQLWLQAFVDGRSLRNDQMAVPTPPPPPDGELHEMVSTGITLPCSWFKQKQHSPFRHVYVPRSWLTSRFVFWGKCVCSKVATQPFRVKVSFVFSSQVLAGCPSQEQGERMEEKLMEPARTDIRKIWHPRELWSQPRPAGLSTPSLCGWGVDMGLALL